MQRMHDFYDEDEWYGEYLSASHYNGEESSDATIRKRRRLSFNESMRCPIVMVPSAMENIFFTLPEEGGETVIKQEESSTCVTSSEKIIEKGLGNVIATCKGHINNLAFSMDEKDFPTDTHTIETAMSVCVYCIADVDKSWWRNKSKPFVDESSMILFSAACFSVACKFCQTVATGQMSYLHR